MMSEKVHKTMRRRSGTLKNTWIGQLTTALTLTHVVQYGPVNKTGLRLSTLELSVDAVDQHVLMNVHLADLKTTCKAIRHAKCTAYVLIPDHAHFKACSAGLTLLNDYPAQSVYETLEARAKSALKLYCNKGPNTEARINSTGVNHTMTFDTFIGGGKCPPTVPIKTLIDTGASHCFIDSNTTAQLKIPVSTTSLNTTALANGSHTKIRGIVTLNVCIQGVLTTTKAYVVDTLPAYPLILGDNWLKSHRAIIDYALFTITLRTDKLQHILYAGEAQGFHQAICHALTLPQISLEHAHHIQRGGGVCFTMQMEVAETLDCEIIGLPPEDDTTKPLVWPTDLPQQINTVIRDYADVFEAVKPGLPPNESGPVITLIPGATPPKSRPYKMTPLELECCHKEVNEKVALGHWTPSRSPFTSPVMFVTKKDGTLRLVHDQKRLNAVTIKQHFPIPRVDEIFDRLAGCSYFSCLDLTSAYSQLRLPEEEVERTSFVVPFGQFESRVLQFGLCNAPAAWSAVMGKLFGPLLKTFVAVYLDDILVFSHTAAEHAKHLKEVLAILRKAQFKVKLSKCSFCKTSLLYLGHRIGKAGLSVDDTKVDAVKHWPVPKTVKELQSFLGLSNYFRRFIQSYSTICAPLTSMTKQDTPWVWSTECQQAFDAVKAALTSAPVLAFPEAHLPYTIISDASLLGTGAVLLQNEQPICFTSSKFSPAELNYTTTDQEFLAVIRALVEWRCYLEGGKYPVTIVTDHNALTFMPTQSTMSRRQARWSEYLQRFNHTWQYIKGEKNMADPLSRCPGPHNNAQKLPGPPTVYVIDAGTLPSIQELLIKGYAQDTGLKKRLTAGQYKQDNQQLWRLDKAGQPSAILVPDYEPCRLAIMRELHDGEAAGHTGPQRTLHTVRRWFYWHGMAKYVTNYVSRCASCQSMKPSTQAAIGPLNPLPIPNAPWESVSMDLLTCLPMTDTGFDTMVVFVDRLTKFCVAVPCKLDTDAAGFADILIDNVIAKYGVPCSLISDRDVRFTSIFFKTLMNKLNIKSGMSTAFHPQSDGQTERMNRLLQETLRHYVSYTQNNWDKHLQLACFAINNSVSESTGFSPFYLNYGRHPRHPSGVANLPTITQFSPTGTDTFNDLKNALDGAKQSLRRAQQVMKNTVDKSRRTVIFKIGDKVLLSTRHLKLKAGPDWAKQKFLPKHIGPFTVLSTVTAPYQDLQSNEAPVPCAVKLDLPSTTRIHPVFNVSLLTHWKDPVEDPLAVRVPQPLDWLDGTPLFKVVGLTGHSWVRIGTNWKLFFKVNWVGDCDDTMEPRAELYNTMKEDIEAYETLHAAAIQADRPINNPRSKKPKTRVPHVPTAVPAAPPLHTAPSPISPAVNPVQPQLPGEQSTGGLRGSRSSARVSTRPARYLSSYTLFHS